MSVTIRLRRIGRKHQPYYRVVVADSRIAADGAYLEMLGHYTSTTRPAELRLDLTRLDDWVARGATMSETVKSLVSKARKGGDASVSFQAVAAEPTPAVESPAVESPAVESPAAAPAPAAAPVEAQPAD
jgi:small subunit ribosomal protein S16